MEVWLPLLGGLGLAWKIWKVLWVNRRVVSRIGLSFECTQRVIVAGAKFHWLSENAWFVAIVGLGFSSKNAIQRQVDRVWKAMWETLKCTNIVE
jgi:hypothetical protein